MTTSKMNGILSTPLIFLVIVGASAGTNRAFAQTVTVLTETSAMTLPAHAVVNQIVFSGAKTAQGAIDSPNTPSAAKPVAMMAASRLLGFAGFAGIPLQIAMSAAPTRQPQMNGFSVYLLAARTADIAVSGNLTFRILTDGEEVHPVLMKLDSLKTQSERIVQASRIQCKQADAACLASPVVLDTQASLAPCRTEVDNETLTLTPEQPLSPGEYAIVLDGPPSADGAEARRPAQAWDFRVQ